MSEAFFCNRVRSSRSHTILAALFAGSILLLAPRPSAAGPIVYGMYGGLGGHQNGDSSNDGSLAMIDPSTGAVTVIGHPSGVSRLSGLVFDLTGNLYGATQGNFPYPPVTPPGASDLVTIDPSTGALVAAIGVIMDGATPINISDLAMQPGTGTLYGVRGPNDGLNGQGRLYTINEQTGAATLVGDTLSFFDSIAFAPNGTLYLSAADLDFNTGNTINPRLQTLNPANANVLTTVATSEFYGALGIRPGDGLIFAGNGDRAQLFTLNPTSGAETLVGSTGRTFVGDIDFLVPEPASIALTGLGALGLALWKIRRRK